jgi:hypothetical protein
LPPTGLFAPNLLISISWVAGITCMYHLAWFKVQFLLSMYQYMHFCPIIKSKNCKPNWKSKSICILHVNMLITILVIYISCIVNWNKIFTFFFSNNIDNSHSHLFIV